jgi:hypothetical protein
MAALSRQVPLRDIDWVSPALRSVSLERVWDSRRGMFRNIGDPKFVQVEAMELPVDEIIGGSHALQTFGTGARFGDSLTCPMVWFPLGVASRWPS